MDIKQAYDNVSRLKLAILIRQWEMNNDLICLTQSFLTNRKVEIAIDVHIDPKREIETAIPQGSPESPSCFLYI